MEKKNLRYKVGKLGVKMPILINLFKKVPWILFMAVTAVALGAFIALSDMTIIVYFMIVLGTFLLSLFLSVLFKHPKSVIQIILFSLSIRVFFYDIIKNLLLSSWDGGILSRGYRCLRISW